MLFIYTLILRIVFVLAFPYMFFRAIISPRYRRVFSHRLGLIARQQKRVWFHCASVGEVKALEPLLRAAEEKLPLSDIAISTMTMAGMDMARKSYKDAGMIFLLPFDLPLIINRAMKAISPRAIVILETEFWPNFLAGAIRNNIPVLLLNGRISEGSFRWYRFLKSFFGMVLKAFVAAGVQSEGDRERLAALGVNRENILVTGNMKYDYLCPADREASADGSLGKSLQGFELFIAGSTHRGEESIILDAFEEIIKSRPRARLLLAPRHLDRMEEVAAEVVRAGFKYVKRTELDSRGKSEPLTEEVILLNTIGELSGLYSLGSAVFVGGSLVPIGGHNVLEPAIAGKAVFFGPHMESFKDARELLLSSGGGKEVKDAEELKTEVLKALEDPKEYIRKGSLARKAILSRRGSARKNLELLEKLL